jgi:hypothetical protein
MGGVSEASIRLGGIEMDMRNGCMTTSMLHLKKGPIIHKQEDMWMIQRVLLRGGEDHFKL